MHCDDLSLLYQPQNVFALLLVLHQQIAGQTWPQQQHVRLLLHLTWPKFNSKELNIQLTNLSVKNNNYILLQQYYRQEIHKPYLFITNPISKFVHFSNNQSVWYVPSTTHAVRLYQSHSLLWNRGNWDLAKLLGTSCSCSSDSLYSLCVLSCLIFSKPEEQFYKGW